MKASLALLKYELRCHAPMLVICVCALVGFVVTHRLVKGSWDYWGSEWSSAGLMLSVVILAPLLALVSTMASWAHRRVDGSLQWYLARPVSTTRLFLLSLLAVVLTIIAYLAIVVVFHLPAYSSATLLFSYGPDSDVRAIPYLPYWPLLVLLALCGGMLVSVAAKSLAQAAGMLMAGAALTLGMANLDLLVFRLIRIPTLQILYSRVVDLQGMRVQLYAMTIAWLCLCCLLAAWVALKKAPFDLSRFWRAAATGGLVYFLGVPLAFLSLLAPQNIVNQVRSLGDNVQVKLRGVEGMLPGVSQPVVVDPEGRARKISDLTFGLYAHPGRGLAVFGSLLDTRNRWAMIDRFGAHRHFFLNESNSPWHAIDWSEKGKHFAWLSQQNLLIMDEDFTMHRYDLPAGLTWSHGFWVDDQHLVITTSGLTGANTVNRERGTLRCSPESQATKPSTWCVYTAKGKLLHGPEEDPGGTFFYPSQPRVERLRALRCRSGVVGWQLQEDGWALVRVGSDDWRLQVMTTVSEPYRCTLGCVGDDDLVWVQWASNSEERVIMKLASGEENAEKIARIKASAGEAGPFQTFVGTVGDWAVFAGYRDVTVCNVNSGQVRNLGESGGKLWPWGAVDVNESAVITANGVIPLPPRG